MTELVPTVVPVGPQSATIVSIAFGATVVGVIPSAPQISSPITVGLSQIQVVFDPAPIPVTPIYVQEEIGPAGPAGTPGPSGTNGMNGSEWYAGQGVPSDDIGNNFDFYFNTLTGDVYEKSSGTWF